MDVQTNTPFDQPTEDVERAILKYLGDNPDAVETFAGIADWWLERNWIRVELSRVKKALDALVRRGELEMFGPAHAPSYRKCAQRR